MKKRKIISKDGIEYTLLVSDKVIQLTENQMFSLERTIKESDTAIIEREKGHDLVNIQSEQSSKIKNKIQSIFNNMSEQDLIDEEYLNFSAHATQRINSREVCIERYWNYGKAELEVAECLNRAYSVEHIRIKFNKNTKKSFFEPAFKIKGSIGRGQDMRDGEVIILFQEDAFGEEEVMVVTILRPEYP